MSTEMSPAEWEIAQGIADSLMKQGVNHNLVLRLQEYLTYHPNASLEDYLERLAKLGDAFAGGKDEPRQRQELACLLREKTAQKAGANWPLVLAWTARLMVAERRQDDRRAQKPKGEGRRREGKKNTRATARR